MGAEGSDLTGSADCLVVDDPPGAAAGRIAAVARAGGSLALAGGSTPRAAYERLAAMEIDWSGCSLWFGDERCVPPDDNRSNFAMVRGALLDRLAESRPAVWPIPAERGPERGAALYEGELRRIHGPGLPRFDLVLLGIGPDGHTASLFPNQAALEQSDRLAVGVPRPGLDPWVSRVTLTLEVINAAREVVFLVSGAGKAAAVRSALRGPDAAVPASLVAPASGKLTWLLDDGAAGLAG